MKNPENLFILILDLGDWNKGVPFWSRTCVINADTGVVYISATAFEINEQAVSTKLEFDGEAWIRDKYGHIYAPAKWLENEYPCCTKKIRLLVKRTRKALKQAHAQEHVATIGTNVYEYLLSKKP